MAQHSAVLTPIHCCVTALVVYIMSQLQVYDYIKGPS